MQLDEVEVSTPRFARLRSAQARKFAAEYSAGTCGFARRPIFVATVTRAATSGRSRRNAPMSVSLRPSP